MANIKSAKKRIWLTEQKLSVINLRSAVKTAIEVEVAVVNKDKETAVNALGAATAIINKAASAFITKTTLLEKFLV